MKKARERILIGNTCVTVIVLGWDAVVMELTLTFEYIYLSHNHTLNYSLYTFYSTSR